MVCRRERVPCAMLCNVKWQAHAKIFFESAFKVPEMPSALGFVVSKRINMLHHALRWAWSLLV